MNAYKCLKLLRGRFVSRCLQLAAAMALAAMLSGCIASRSEIMGAYGGQPAKNTEAKQVSVFFQFRHMGQQHGMDTIPKLHNQTVVDFDNIFRNALGELSNVSRYDTYMELTTDVNNPERRQKLETLKAANDYTLEVTFLEESSFSQQFISGAISLVSLTAIPVPYSWDYTITAVLKDKEGGTIRSYSRTATLSNWVEGLLIVVYPFYPYEGKREEIYSESLHDIFRQMEAEKVLK